MKKSLDKVQEIGMKMGITQYVIDAGKGYYRLAATKRLDDATEFSKKLNDANGIHDSVGYGFVQGRSVVIVAAVCLYTACRV